MGLAIGQETHALCWNNPRPGAQVARAALSYLWNQGENGICCPIGMTYSAVPILRRDPARWTEWGHLITSTSYDRRQVRATDKTGATVGMAMTEKQGGSDLRQTETRALPQRRRHMVSRRAQMVLLRPTLGRVPDAGADRRRRVLLRGRRLAAGRLAQPG